MPLVSWTRLEPRPRDATLNEGLQARVADPLWLLARQAVFGEFQGEDNGSPVGVRVRARTDRLSRFRSGGVGSSAPTTLLTSATSALEAVVEAETETASNGLSAPGALASAEAGQYYLRLLARAAGVGDLSTYRTNLIGAYQFSADARAD